MTGEQRSVLAAAVERILPSDDGPGAVETGAAAYIERLLETNLFRSWQPLFDDGLDRFEELAQELYGRSFPAGSPEERNEVLRRFQAETDRLRQAFFRKLVSFTLVLEKGPRHRPEDYPADEVANQRHRFFLPYLDGEPHTVVTPKTTRPVRTELGWIATCVGGGTVHMGAFLYRFHPDDFRMRSRFGPVEELADWPFGYDELEPYYALAEREVGVAGLVGVNPFEAPRSSPCPLPPLDSHPITPWLEEAGIARSGRSAW